MCRSVVASTGSSAWGVKVRSSELKHRTQKSLKAAILAGLAADEDQPARVHLDDQPLEGLVVGAALKVDELQAAEDGHLEGGDGALGGVEGFEGLEGGGGGGRFCCFSTPSIRLFKPKILLIISTGNTAVERRAHPTDVKGGVVLGVDDLPVLVPLQLPLDAGEHRVGLLGVAEEAAALGAAVDPARHQQVVLHRLSVRSGRVQQFITRLGLQQPVGERPGGGPLREDDGVLRVGGHAEEELPREAALEVGLRGEDDRRLVDAGHLGEVVAELQVAESEWVGALALELAHQPVGHPLHHRLGELHHIVADVVEEDQAVGLQPGGRVRPGPLQEVGNLQRAAGGVEGDEDVVVDVDAVGDEERGPGDLLEGGVAAVQVLLRLVVDVRRVDDVLAAVLDDAPDGAADHVAGGQRSEGDALAAAFQNNGLVVLHLRHPLEGEVDVVEGEELKVLVVVP
ncbi:hypothetical protein TYRP_006855 [Tyrophagus putrescentiae]|nr:hypothetical protein TYRP_006855 [Tyrophagus putrescentiae]